MKIVVIGWYGTETIGDRAILAGLIKGFADTFGYFEVKLGSLYPFFTNRTVNEDYEFWKVLKGGELNIEIFDSSKLLQLTKAIQDSELVVMGGGPLMHISELHMVEFAFKYAKKINRKTAVLGCGVGPIFNRRYHRALLNIIEESDLVILRDSASLRQLRDVASLNNINIKKQVALSLDPAVIACDNFNNNVDKGRLIDQNTICINLRSFSSGYSKVAEADLINEKLSEFVSKISVSNPDKEIKLMPMHYFHIGDDDRIFLNKIQSKVDAENITVQNHPLSLYKTIDAFSDAGTNYGMRFHSVVFQTLVSGNNYILDYTEPRKGKVSGFIHDIDKIKFYSGRYVNLQIRDATIKFDQDKSDHFKVDGFVLKSALDIYVERLCGLF